MYSGIRTAAAWAAIALTLTGVGCGGGSAGTGEETVPLLTKGQLVHRMDEICQPHSEQQAAAVEAFEKKHGYPLSSRGPVPKWQMEKELTVVILPFVRETIREMKQLDPNPQQKQTLIAFIAALEHGVAFSEKDQSWIVPGAAKEPFQRARELSWKLGTALCGQA